MATPIQTSHSDSEDDEDYIPPAQDAESSDEESEPDAKRARTQSPKLTEEDEAAKKRERDMLWASFQASVSDPTTTPAPSEDAPKKMIKVEKKYLFAGEQVKEVVEVPEDSPEAKKWPIWNPTEQVAESSRTGSPSTLDSAPASSSQSPAPVQKPPMKKPGPRKPKTSLSALPGPSKAKKLTTLDKSAMDWRAHIQAQEQSGIKDELEANRRGGGYLEKLEFLERVDARKEEKFEELKGNKRRRG